MIGPAASFYDPTSVVQDDADAQRYQQWVQGYSTGQQYPQQHHQQQFHFDFSNPNPRLYHSYNDAQGYSATQQDDLYGGDYYMTATTAATASSSTATPYHQQPQHYADTYTAPPHDRTSSVSQSPEAHQTVATTTSNGPKPRQAGQKRAAPSTAKQAAGPTNRAAGGKRKRSKRVVEDDRSDSGSDDDDLAGGMSVGMGGMGLDSSTGRSGRLPGACTYCKKLKMKCDFPEGENTCKRCRSSGHVCIVEGRKPRTAPNKREYLLAQIRQKDAIIESLLKQLHNPYIATPLSIASYRMATSPSDQNNKNVMAWLERLQASVQDAGKNGTRAFKLDARGEEHEESDTESDNGTSHLTHAQRFGLVPVVDNTNDSGGPVDGSSADDKINPAGKKKATEDDEIEQIQNSLPDSHVPLGLIANLSLSNNPKAKAGHREDPLNDDIDDDNVGVANETYFMPGPATDLDIRAMLIEQHSPPEILVHGLVTPEDVDKLFEIFYNRINPFISLLDPVLHTPALTFSRCPFLFTVICAISSRYYAEKSEIYPIAMHFAKHSAAVALIDGWKSVELCQAYILMSIYSVPARRWEEDRSWLYTGLAIRIATDLNLHQAGGPKPHNQKQERELLNRTRVWMICFNLDRSTATQFGKPSTIKEDYIMRYSKDWYKKSPYNHQYDVHLCAYTALFRVVAKFHDEIFSDPKSASGLNKTMDFRTVTLTHDAHLTRYEEEWTMRFKEAAANDHDEGSAFRCLLLPFYVSYSRLVMFSFGFQQAYQRGLQNTTDNLFFHKCFDSAKTVIRTMIEDLAPSGYMKYAPDGHFVFTSFASAFLLKLLNPEISHLLNRESESEIYELIGKLIETLSRNTISIDDRHTPKLHARFLANLLTRHRRGGAGVGIVGRLQTSGMPGGGNISSGGGGSYSGSGQAGSSMSSFSMNPGNNNPSQYSSSQQHQAQATPIYRPEATYAFGTNNPITFGDDMSIFDNTMIATGALDDPATSGSGMLAPMHALSNPAWWENMMMPGFSWSDPESPASSQSVQSSRSSPGHYGHPQTGLVGPGYGMYGTGLGALQPVGMVMNH